jgi:hypothetical protein
MRLWSGPAKRYGNEMPRRSTSDQQDNQHDQQNGAETTADIRATVVEAATTEQQKKNNNKDDKVHAVSPPGYRVDAKTTASANATSPPRALPRRAATMAPVASTCLTA